MWKLLVDRLKMRGSSPDPEVISNLHARAPVSYASRFPDIPSPAERSLPILIAAQWTCGWILPEDTPSLAADLLEQGLDSPSLRQLAGEISGKTRRDIEGLVARTFRELRVPYPMDQTFARKFATREIAREVIAGKRNVWAASLALERVTDWDWKHDIESLYTILGLNDELELDGHRPIADIEEDLIQTFAELGAPNEREKRLKDRGFGALEGKGWASDDFDGPLPDELLAYFDGRHADPFLDDAGQVDSQTARTIIDRPAGH